MLGFPVVEIEPVQRLGLVEVTDSGQFPVVCESRIANRERREARSDASLAIARFLYVYAYTVLGI